MRWNGASCCELVGKSMETETTTWSKFPNNFLMISSNETCSKLKVFSLYFSDIAFTLGWFLYFSMALKTGSLMWLTFSRRSSSIAKLSSVTIFAKNLLNSSAIA